MNRQMFNVLLERLLALAGQKKQAMEEIKTLTERQSALLVPEKAGELLSLIESKQEYIDRIKVIDDEAGRVKEQILTTAGLSAWEEGQALFGGRWETIERTRQDTLLLVGQIVETDRQNSRKLSEECRRLKQDRQNLLQRRGSLRAYRSAAFQPDGYFIDHKK